MLVTLTLTRETQIHGQGKTFDRAFMKRSTLRYYTAHCHVWCSMEELIG